MTWWWILAATVWIQILVSAFWFTMFWVPKHRKGVEVAVRNVLLILIGILLLVGVYLFSKELHN